MAIANALPRPATVPCFLQALERPLYLHANHSFQSLQPSSGERSPRIFLFFDPLYMSVVPVGSGTNLLELGVLDDKLRSTKGEIEFPVTDDIAADDPYLHIQNVGSDGKIYGTVCASCHSFEAPSDSIPGAFTSTAYRPRLDDDVSTTFLAKEAQNCDRTMEPDRCAMLEAIFHGEVIPHEFSPDMATFSK